MRVHLIHGMGRSPVSMMLLGKRLANVGHEVHRFGYFVSQHSLDDITTSFLDHVRSAGPKGEPYAVIGHSLGGIITRLASPRLPEDFHRFVMIGPPNRPPALAKTMSNFAAFRALTQDAGRKLADDGFYATLPVPAVKTLVIAGTSGPRTTFPHKGSLNDGVVAVHETELEGAEYLHVPAIHTVLMNDVHVIRRINEFLR